MQPIIIIKTCICLRFIENKLLTYRECRMENAGWIQAPKLEHQSDQNKSAKIPKCLISASPVIPVHYKANRSSNCGGTTINCL